MAKTKKERLKSKRENIKNKMKMYSFYNLNGKYIRLPYKRTHLKRCLSKKRREENIHTYYVFLLARIKLEYSLLAGIIEIDDINFDAPRNLNFDPLQLWANGKIL